MTLFVILGPGSAVGIVNTEGSAWVLWVSLTPGLAVATLSNAFSTCDNQINCAVTFVLVAVVKFLRESSHVYSTFFSSCIGIHIAQLVTQLQNNHRHTTTDTSGYRAAKD